MNELSVPAYAKVNLSLELLGKRDDGYHEILTIMQSISLKDELLVADARELSLECDVAGLEGEANLVIRAARALRSAAGVAAGARIRLRKGIPVASGLGGASADAACVLVALTRLWGLDPTGLDLAGIAANLGSDVPFFLSGGTALASGRGEKLAPLPSPPERWLVLLVPSHSLEAKTVELYRRIRPEHWSSGDSTRRLASALKAGMALDESLMVNSFESVADQSFPSLPSYREAMLEAGASRVHLSGAGPTIYCLTEGRETADRMAGQLRSLGFSPLLARTVSSPMDDSSKS
ncbi:MAG TPA: 4-(cytidine 5'-diphospho)-2-C-methyl-D-erythritol kinase [Chloroflexota bacterium]|nr:4-(cytidine 5'-diphospho)-2-C-methyl-D-erythritol kinase [Chloroflexota bacterium]